MTLPPPDQPPSPFLIRWWRSFVVAPLRGANEEARVYLESPAGRRVDRKTITILVAGALILTIHYYLCRTDQVRGAADTLRMIGLSGLSAALRAWIEQVEASEINRWTYWALAGFFSYAVAPALLIRLVFRERLADYGFKLRGAFADAWVYLVMLAVVGPLVWTVAHGEEFQQTYPFYQHPHGTPLWPDFWRWEFVYGLQFLGVEFFFRGFLVHGLRRRFGAYCIPIMVVPYCMIHFGKPLPETLASIVAGLALGFMSVRTRSIVLGVAIHVTVAMSMDFTSMYLQHWFG